MKIEFSESIPDIKFSSDSEKESRELTGLSCYKSLLDANFDKESMTFHVVSDGDIYSVGVISHDNFMTLFTISEKHSIGYIRTCARELINEANKRGFIFTKITYWHKKARKFLKHIGFYMSNKTGGEETWVLEPKR